MKQKLEYLKVIKKRFIQHGINPAIRKILYYTLVMTVIAALVVPADARGNHGRPRRDPKRKCKRVHGKHSRFCK